MTRSPPRRGPRLSAQNRHRAVFVITDGVDTGSRMKPQEVSGIASSIDVPVYLLTVVNPLDHPGGELAVIEAAGEHNNVARSPTWLGGPAATCASAACRAHGSGCRRSVQ